MILPAVLRRRRRNVCKTDFGHVLVCAGSPTMLGAACLVSLAAMRAGAGLVTAAVPRGLNLALQRKLSHAVMTFPVPGGRGDVFTGADAAVLLSRREKYTAVVVGPGLGTASGTRAFVQTVVRAYPLPMVVDADALNALAADKDRGRPTKGWPAARIFTPHPGEFERLTGHKPASAQDRRRAAYVFARECNVVLVLKGHGTVVAAPDGETWVDRAGGPVLAKAGTGDVLAGIIGALLAQGLAPFSAACAGVKLHAAAGQSVQRMRSVFSATAIDLMTCIGAYAKR